MAYSLARLTSRAECDTLLEMAQDDRKTLEFRKLSFERQQESYQDKSLDVQTELQAVQAQLTALNTIIPALPEGDEKENQITKQKKFEVRQRELNDRQEDYGVTALLDKEFDIACIAKSLEDLTVYVAALEARKAELPA